VILKKMERTSLNIEDLIVLHYAPNTCYVQVVDVKDFEKKELKIDIPKGTWSYDFWKDVKIGRARSEYGRYSSKIHDGIIGVYNRHDTKHLDQLAHDALNFTHTTDSAVDDV